MSEYLGWSERRPPVGSKSSSSLDRDVLPGGPVTHSYENYVKNIFHPANRLKNKVILQKSRGEAPISAAAMLRMERSFGRDALDDSHDKEDWTFVKTPLESLYEELGVKHNDSAHYRQFPVYEPKQSSEYFSISHGGPERSYRDNYSSSNYGSGGYTGALHSPYISDPKEDEYEKNNRMTLIDYKDFNSSPLSPYLYRDHPYVRSQDSRIVGSNFVQVTSRPKDRFLEKVEKTLAEVRAMPRYT